MQLDYMDILCGMLEMVVISVIALGLGGIDLEYNGPEETLKMRSVRMARYAAATIFSAVVITSINSFDIPYHGIITVGGTALIYIVIAGKKPLDSLADTIFGFAWVFLFETTGMLIIMAMSAFIKVPEPFLRLAMLVIIVIASVLFMRAEKVRSFLARHYISNRKPILWVEVSVFVIFTFVINLMVPQDTRYSNRTLEILVLVSLYVILNGMLIVNLIKKREAEDQLFKAKEYDEYLHSVLQSMRSKRHEYKNHIQHILSISESEGEEGKLREIRNYASSLLDEDVTSKGSTPETENTSLSVFLFQIDKRAKEEGVNLELFISRPLPDYRIPDRDLIGLLSNAANNAIEAERSLPKEKRNVFISLEKDHIEVANTISIDRDVQYGISTKGGSERGFGLSNMRDIAEKHNIKLETYVENDEFIVVIEF